MLSGWLVESTSFSGIAVSLMTKNSNFSDQKYLKKKMDRWKTTTNEFSQSAEAAAADLVPSTSPHSLPPSNSVPESRQRQEAEVKDPIAARKVQKADREKLRRDRLNEQFFELGNTLDPDRPKNDKATILTDTIQMLKDLTAEVSRLKDEHAALSEESRELMQEKNELREEKASLKSDIENLNAQYQQRMRVMYPWPVTDPSVVMGSTYSYPIPVPVTPSPIPMHMSLQPFPLFGNQNTRAIPTTCSTFIPYPTPINPTTEQASVQYPSAHIPSKPDSKNKLADNSRSSNSERYNDSIEVATELELKMPGSSNHQETSSEERKGKQLQRKERNCKNGSSSSRYSSSHDVQDSSSNSIGDISRSSN